uniref:Histone deacetylase n=1 Tax=Bursaphelenchus xylophilus TaxID=6326 RepID=A0A1I7S990_BURXY
MIRHLEKHPVEILHSSFSCSSNPSDSQFDLKPEVYKIGRSIEGVRLVKDEICNGVGEVEVLTETDPEHVFSAALYKRVLAYKGDSE